MFLTIDTWRALLGRGALDAALARLYGAQALPRQRARHLMLLDRFAARFGPAREAAILSAPGRTELCGNHTDHQGGRVLAAAVTADCLAVVSPSGAPGRAALASEGYAPLTLSLEQLAPAAGERGTTAALLRGAAHCLAARGAIAGFDAALCSDVPAGAGLSSSAACAVLLGACLTACAGRMAAPEMLALAAQHAENEYFGKPSGLMDQMASAVGGLLLMDFREPGAPRVTRLDADFARCGLAVLLTDTGGSHADMTQAYAAIPRDMRLAARALGSETLGAADPAAFEAALPGLRGRVPALALLRAMHFFDENARVPAMAAALAAGDAARVIALARASGRSSFELLQNVCPADPEERGLALALALGERALRARGAAEDAFAVRVHGGGFAGTIQSFVPRELANGFRADMERLFGPGSCAPAVIRPVGVTALRP